jgi:hypothetical protein
MAILKFRVYLEQDDTVYRDIAIRHTDSFDKLHYAILTAYEFDNKHQATFFRSNDNWDRGREISLEQYDKPYKVLPLLMQETIIATEIKDTNQKFIYLYDFNKLWTFLVELIQVAKDDSSRTVYPSITRKEGIGPPQYGTKGLLGEKFQEIEEKYDLKELDNDLFNTENDTEESDNAVGDTVEDDF